MLTYVLPKLKTIIIYNLHRLVTIRVRRLREGGDEQLAQELEDCLAQIEEALKED